MEEIFLQIKNMEESQVFTINDLNYSCSKSNLYKILRKLKKDNIINLAFKGIYYKVYISDFLNKPIPPNIMDVVRKIVEKNGEIIQYHGADIANKFRISTQMPLTYVFLTSGYSRQIIICGGVVKFIHTSNKKILQYSMQPLGKAISCLYYLGEDIVNDEIISKIKISIGEKDFEHLRKLNLEKWINEKLENYENS